MNWKKTIRKVRNALSVNPKPIQEGEDNSEVAVYSFTIETDKDVTTNQLRELVMQNPWSVTSAKVSSTLLEDHDNARKFEITFTTYNQSKGKLVEERVKKIVLG